MRLKPQQLLNALKKDTLLPSYLITGDEPLQQGELTDAIRARARRTGFEERIVLEVEPGFDWSSLAQHSANLSLFSTRRLIELRLGNSKPGKEGGSALLDYCNHPNPENTLLITAAKLDKPAQQTKWFKALEKLGVVVQVWPVDGAELPRWISARMAARDIRITPEAAALIAERVEGNLLAASQELDVLRLLIDGDRITAEDVITAVADSSRYDVFQLVDAALCGDLKRTLRILSGLRHEGVEPILVNWALTREVRMLARIAQQLAAGKAADAVFSEFRLWRNRVNAVKLALRRHSCRGLQGLILVASGIERIIKGIAPGNAWDELTELSLQLARTTRG